MKSDLTIRHPDQIYVAKGRIVDGTFSGKWHFSFDEYVDPANMHFGNLRVFNDDTISPGAIWPLHPHRDIEVVTYCAGGEFLHEDERGKGGILRKGWVQQTTVGRGMYHSEINNRADKPMRFIQMWFFPRTQGLEPSVKRKEVDIAERTDRLLPLVSNHHEGALPIQSDGAVFSSFLRKEHSFTHKLRTGSGAYLYVLEGGPITVNGSDIAELGAVKLYGPMNFEVMSQGNAELLLVEVALTGDELRRN